MIFRLIVLYFLLTFNNFKYCPLQHDYSQLTYYEISLTSNCFH